MKDGKKHWLQICNRILSGIMVLLGFSACDSVGTGTCMYGQPFAKFELKGKVVDSHQQPISKARIVLKNVTTASSDNGWNRDTLYTQNSGNYLYTDNFAWPEMKYRVVCEDPTGVYQSDSTEVKMEPKKGDGNWYAGWDSKEVNFQLKKKEQ